MKIKLINEADKAVITEYEAVTVPCKHELVTFENKTVKVCQINYFIKKNEMAQINQINYVSVIVKEVVNAI